MGQRIRLGMVGGGRGAFIGAVHRIAARLDDHFELVAGALSSDPERSRASATDLGIAADRAYADFRDMVKQESQRPDGIQAVSIVTPNHMHAEPAIAFLEAGIHVICDKPVSSNLDDAKRIQRAAEMSSARFVLTHNYTGYPLMRHARELIKHGELGRIRVVQAEYAQDWLAEPIEQEGQKQASWRTDPKQSGAGGAIGDIGTHAFNLISFVTGLRTEALAADLHRFVDGRVLDDNAHVLLRLEGGAKGMVWASQVAVGQENGLRLRIFGEKGSITWNQENPNRMVLDILGKPSATFTRGGVGFGGRSGNWTRTPPGHPEGYLEGFANIYVDAAKLIRGEDSGVPLPGIEDGLLGVRFIEACVESDNQNTSWVPLAS